MRFRIRAPFAVAGLVGAALVVPVSGVSFAERGAVAARFVGSWNLLSATLRAADGSTTQPYGPDPVGKLTYTPGGQVWALVARDVRPKGDAGANWYTGTFTVRAKAHEVVHHVRYSNVADWEGHDLVRKFRFRGSRLELTVAAGNGRLVLVWSRLGQ